MKNVCLISVLVLMSSSVFGQSEIFLTTQAEIDAFDQENVTKSLYISGEDIVDLSPLDSIKSITKGIIIEDCPNLEQISGFNQITSLGLGFNWSPINLGEDTIRHSLRIRNNSSLKTITGFKNLKAVSRKGVETGQFVSSGNIIYWSADNQHAHYVTISGNPKLEKVQFESLTTCIRLEITNNESLDSLIFDSKLRAYYYHIWTTVNGEIIENGRITISNNPNLSYLKGEFGGRIFKLDGYLGHSDSLSFTYNRQRFDIINAPKIEQLDIYGSSNPGLFNIDECENLKEINFLSESKQANVRLLDGNQLHTLSGTEYATEISLSLGHTKIETLAVPNAKEGLVSVWDNDGLESIVLDSFIDGSVILNRNNALEYVSIPMIGRLETSYVEQGPWSYNYEERHSSYITLGFNPMLKKLEVGTGCGEELYLTNENLYETYYITINENPELDTLIIFPRMNKVNALSIYDNENLEHLGGLYSAEILCAEIYNNPSLTSCQVPNNLITSCSGNNIELEDCQVGEIQDNYEILNLIDTITYICSSEQNFDLDSFFYNIKLVDGCGTVVDSGIEVPILEQGIINVIPIEFFTATGVFLAGDVVVIDFIDQSPDFSEISMDLEIVCSNQDSFPLTIENWIANLGDTDFNLLCTDYEFSSSWDGDTSPGTHQIEFTVQSEELGYLDTYEANLTILPNQDPPLITNVEPLRLEIYENNPDLESLIQEWLDVYGNLEVRHNCGSYEITHDYDFNYSTGDHIFTFLVTANNGMVAEREARIIIKACRGQWVTEPEDEFIYCEQTSDDYIVEIDQWIADYGGAEFESECDEFNYSFEWTEMGDIWDGTYQPGEYRCVLHVNGVSSSLNISSYFRLKIKETLDPPVVTAQASHITLALSNPNLESLIDDWIESQGGGEAIDNCGSFEWSHDYDYDYSEGYHWVRFRATSDNGEWSETVAHISIQEVVSTSDFAISQIEISPNPASDVITLSNLVIGSTLSIHAIDGSELWSKKIDSESILQDLTEYPQGVYSIIVTDEKSNRVVKRFVKL